MPIVADLSNATVPLTALTGRPSQSFDVLQVLSLRLDGWVFVDAKVSRLFNQVQSDAFRFLADGQLSRFCRDKGVTGKTAPLPES